MLDIKIIRQNPDAIKKIMKNRNNPMDSVIDNIINIDSQRRELCAEVEELKAKQNKVSKEIPLLKKSGADVCGIMSEMKLLSDKISNIDSTLSKINSEQRDILLSIPNIYHDSVPVGSSENDNPEIRKFSEPRNFEFEPKSHWDIGNMLGILDSESATKVTGARFHFYKGLGARLERAVINFYLDSHIKNGYTEIFPPFMVNRASMTGTGQLPKFENDAFKIEGTDYFLIPTAEVPVTNIHREEILDGSNFPIKYCAYSACFRSEAGSAGRDQKGLIRQHQFNKVELVKFCTPENSYDELEKLTKDAESVLQALNLPYRVVSLCSGDLGFSSAKTYDIEVYMPSYGTYKEISSCSNFEDYQARRANIRFKNNPKDKAQLVHTLNGSGVAIGRTVAAIIENYQNDNGSVTVPDVLVPYMGCQIIV